MKKLTLVAILIFTLVLSACGKSNNDGASNGGSASSPNASESAGGSPAASGDGKGLKVVLLIPGVLGDKSFFDAANRGLQMIHDQLGATTKVIEMGTDKTKWEPTYTDIASQDWDVIISGGSEISEVFNATAAAHPEKKFINYDTDVEETEPNLFAMTYATNEVSFLAGATAALTSTSGLPGTNPDKVIGFVGGMDIPGINAFLVGYIEGAKYVVPDIKVAISYAGDFGNPAKGKELSLIQYNSGADIIFNVAGGTGLGIFDAAKEKKRFAIGVDSDQAMLLKDTDSEKANLIVTSAIKKIDQAIFNSVKKIQDGTLEFGKRQLMGFNEDGVGIAENEIYQKVLSEEVRKQIDDVKAKLVNKEIQVSNAMGMETSAVEQLRNSVKP